MIIGIAKRQSHCGAFSLEWADFLARDPAIRSSTSICLKIVDPWFAGLDETQQRAAVSAACRRLDQDRVGYDVGGYRAAPPGFRIWGGATVETSDIEAFLPWLDWAYREVRTKDGGPAG